MKTKSNMTVKKDNWKFKLHPIWKMNWTEFLAFLLTKSLDKDIKIKLTKTK